MREKIISLELSVQNGGEETKHYLEKMEKMKASIVHLESEKRGLQDELTRAEGRAGKLELQRVSLEGDIQRLQMMLHEKEANMQVRSAHFQQHERKLTFLFLQKLQERCEAQGRSMASLEERCASLKSTIDQLNVALERADSSENDFRIQLQNLERTLLDNNSKSHAGTEKLKHLQKSLMNAENERRVLSERLDHSQQNLAELRRSKDQLEDVVTHLRNEIATNEVQRAGLESQLRLSQQWPDTPTTVGEDRTRYIQTGRDNDISSQLVVTQRERSELRGKVDSLTEKIRQLESDKRSLERAITNAKSSGMNNYERPEKSIIYGDSGADALHLEQECRELRLKVRRLESQLAEKEAECARHHRQRPVDYKLDRSEIERARTAQLQAERLLEAREQSHRQQVLRLENQVRKRF